MTRASTSIIFLVLLGHLDLFGSMFLLPVQSTIQTFGTTSPLSSAATDSVVETFDSPHANSQFNHLTVNTETQMLYIGAVNRLYSLYPNLTLLEDVETGPKLDNPDCPPPVPEFQDCLQEKKLTNSYIKALVVDYTHQRLIACSRLGIYIKLL